MPLRSEKWYLNEWVEIGTAIYGKALSFPITHCGEYASRFLYHSSNQALVQGAISTAYHLCQKVHQSCGETFLVWPYYELLTHIKRVLLEPRKSPKEEYKTYSEHLLHSCITACIGGKILKRKRLTGGKRLREHVRCCLYNQFRSPAEDIRDALVRYVDDFNDTGKGSQHQLKQEEILKEIELLFAVKEDPRDKTTGEERVERLWYLSALYHDIGYHIVTLNEMLDENCPETDGKNKLKKSYNCLPQREREEDRKEEKSLWMLLAAVSPFDTTTFNEYVELAADLRRRHFTPEEYNEYIFRKMGLLHPFWSTRELLKVAWDLILSVNNDKAALNVFKTTILLVVAASAVFTHHVFSVGNIRDLKKSDNNPPQKVKELYGCLEKFQNTVFRKKGLKFEEWPLGFLLHFVDSCDHFPRLKAEDPVTAVLGEKGRIATIVFQEPKQTIGLSIPDACDGENKHLKIKVGVTSDNAKNPRGTKKKDDEKLKDAKERYKYFKKFLERSRDNGSEFCPSLEVPDEVFRR